MPIWESARVCGQRARCLLQYRVALLRRFAPPPCILTANQSAGTMPPSTCSRTLVGETCQAYPHYPSSIQLIFSVQLGWFPNSNRFPPNVSPPVTITGLYTIDSLLSGNWNQFFISLHHLALPSLTLGILLSGIFERIVRVNLQQTLQADYVEAARARGIAEKNILFSHALKNALIPVITVLGLTFASLLGGAILTEVTFSWPGLANRLYQAISDRDYPTVQGVLVFFGAIVVAASILIDILNAYIDRLS